MRSLLTVFFPMTLAALGHTPTLLAAADVAANPAGYCSHRVSPELIAGAFPTALVATNLPASLRGVWWVTE